MWVIGHCLVTQRPTTLTNRYWHLLEETLRSGLDMDHRQWRATPHTPRRGYINPG